MALIYRTTDLAKWGAGIGANLIASQVDNNIWELATRIVELETNPALPVGIANVVASNSQFIIVLTNGVELGPFTLPVAVFGMRDEWLPATQYLKFNVFTVADVGVFMALVDHISAATFDPNAVNAGLQPLYFQVFGVATGGNSVDTFGAIEHAAFNGI